MGEISRPTSHRHPSHADLAAFAVGKLQELQAAVVEHHVNQCERCAAVVAQAPRDAFVDRLLAAERSTAISARRDSRSVESEPSEALNETELDRLPHELREHPRYEILRIIAEGGMSTVYLARHRVTRSLVALKTIKPELASSREPVGRFLREARIVGQLNHENIARVLDAEQHGEIVFIAMENVPGRTLAQIVAAKGPLGVAESCHYVRQVALGLQHACDRGVVHRDIKPANIMVLPSSQSVRILDFGLGRLVDEQRTRSRLTRNRQILGTPNYMAPEQANDSKSADIRSDIYSLGCTLYFLLVGEPPFQAPSAIELLSKHEIEPAPSVRSMRREVPQQVSDLLDRMLAKNPKDRPQSPSEIAKALLPYIMSKRAARPVESVGDERIAGNAALARFKAIVARAALTPAVMLPLVTVLVFLLVLWLF